jgi:hypothetical protein
MRSLAFCNAALGGGGGGTALSCISAGSFAATGGAVGGGAGVGDVGVGGRADEVESGVGAKRTLGDLAMELLVVDPGDEDRLEDFNIVSWTRSITGG